MDFKKLKSQSAASFTKINNEIEKMKKKGSAQADPRKWQLEMGKDGKGDAIIRFLPPAPSEEIPFVKMFKHSFQGPTGLWYIENSLTTIGGKDPIGEYNTQLWNMKTGSEARDKANQDIVRKQKRKLVYTANIQVLKYTAHPEDEGCNFLFDFGAKIMEKLEQVMHPEDEDKTAFNPFDFWSGANFRIKVRMKDGFRNYDTSEFDAPSKLFAGDDIKLEALWKAEYPLQPEVAPDKFKTYDELKARFDAVFNLTPVLHHAPAQVRTPQEENAMNPNFAPRDEVDPDVRMFQNLVEQED